MSESPTDVAEQALDRLRGLAADLAGSDSPYGIAQRIHFAAMAGIPIPADEPGDRQRQLNDQLHALWLRVPLQGSLTDWIENKPQETAEAETAMRRAASEWLPVTHDEKLWRPYFDRWLYDEMGYERP
jgi:hypothetical protein